MRAVAKVGLPLQLAWIVCVVAFGITIYPLYTQHGLDFDTLYSIGEVVKSGHTDKIYYNSDISPPSVYSPLAIPFFYLMTFIPIGPAKLFFFLGKLALFALWPYFLSLLLASRAGTDNWKFAAGCIACVIILPSIVEEAIVGNYSINLITFLMVAALAAAEGYIAVAAFILVALACFKPQFYAIFVVALLLRNFWQTVRGGLAGTCAVLLFSLTIFDIRELAQHFANWLSIIKIPIASAHDINNMSTGAVIARWFAEVSPSQIEAGRMVSLSSAIAGEQTIQLVTWIVNFFFVTIGFWGVWRISRQRHQPSEWMLMNLALISVINLTTSPVVWLTHYMLLVFILTAMLHALASNRVMPRALFLLGMAAVFYLTSRFLYTENTLQLVVKSFGLCQLMTVLVALLFLYDFFCGDRNSGSHEQRLPLS